MLNPGTQPHEPVVARSVGAGRQQASRPAAPTGLLRPRRIGAIGLSLAFVFSASSADAQQSGDGLINADRPGIADGSTTVGLHRFQIETAIQVEYRHDGAEHDRTTFIPTLLRYGVGDKWELRLEGNTYSRIAQSDPINGRTHTSGLAPTSIGVKYNFLDASGTERPSLGAILRIFPPSGSGDFRKRASTGDLRLAADWNLAQKWSFNPNLGIAVYEDGSNRIYHTALLAATLNFNPSKKLNFFVDTGVQSRESKAGKASMIVDIGGAYIIGRNIQLDFSVGRGTAGATPPHPFLAAGFSERF